MKTLKVSIIVPIYNGALLIGRCLDSIFNQNGDYQLEVIVVDDGSTDNSAELTRSYSKSIILIDQPNQGPAAARNRGIEVATGKYLAFLDADDFWLPDFLNKTVQFLEKNNETIAVSVGQLHKRPGKQNIIAPEILRIKPAEIVLPISLNDFFSFWSKHSHVCTGSVLMRTDIVKRTGGQRPELRITEDLEFWAYLATFGKWGFIPSVLFVSDGARVTKQKGWINKNRNRWVSAPSVEEWEKRIIDRIDNDQFESYKMARGRIAGNLAYSMIMSKRKGDARDIIIKHKKYLKNNLVNALLVKSTGSRTLWIIVCIFIRTREAFRNLVT